MLEKDLSEAYQAAGLPQVASLDAATKEIILSQASLDLIKPRPFKLVEADRISQISSGSDSPSPELPPGLLYLLMFYIFIYVNQRPNSHKLAIIPVGQIYDKSVTVT